MGSITPNSIISGRLRMNLEYLLALVLPLMSGCLGLSSCDRDLLPCTDNGDNICDCPSEEPSRDQPSRDRKGRSGALEGLRTVSCGQCKFPFMYRGIKYIECTTVNNWGVPWCATTTHSNGDTNLWSNCNEGSSCTIRHDVLDEINKLRRMRQGLRMLIRDASLEERAEEYANFHLPCPSFDPFDQGGFLPARFSDMTWGEVTTGATGVKMFWNSTVEMMNQQYSRIGIGIASNCQSQRLDAWKAVALFA